MRHSVEEIRLKNGARGLLIDVPGATTMSMQFQFRAGSRYAKSKDIEQVAHIMEHMAYGTNTKYSSDAFEIEFTKNGAYRNAYTSDMSLVYEANCADFEWERILDLQQLSICNAKFTNSELESERGNVKSELTGYLNDHQRILWPKLYQAMGEDVLTPRQSLATIANVKLSDIREHYKRTHTTDNMRFVIAGKLRGRKSLIKGRIGGFELPRGERFALREDVINKANATLIRRKDATNLTFGFSMVIQRELNDGEINALNCLNHILTGTFYSRIFGKARKRGLAYNVCTYANSSFDLSSWEVAGQVNHESSPELFDLIANELRHVLSGEVTDEEIEAAKSFGLGRHQMGAQTVQQISNFYTGRYFYDEFIREYEKVPDKIKKVSKKQMVDIANQFITEDKWVLAAVSSCERQELIDLSDKLAGLFEKG